MKSFKSISMFAIVLLCAVSLFAKSEGVVIEPSSPENPFLSTSWDCKGTTLFEFSEDGKMTYGFSEVSYKLKKIDESYELTFKVGPVKSVVTLENKDSTTAICKTKAKTMITMVCTKK